MRRTQRLRVHRHLRNRATSHSWSSGTKANSHARPTRFARSWASSFPALTGQPVSAKGLADSQGASWADYWQ